MKFLAAAATVAAVLSVYAFFAGVIVHPAPVSHPHRTVPARSCIQLVLEPAMFACADKRVYLVNLTSHRWVDIGPVTAVPGVPQR